jgi:ABC-type branched-subunit amino acid transport system substrate-binding protein
VVRGGVVTAVALALLATLVGGCGSSEPDEQRTLTIVVNAPFSQTPYVGETIARGAELAVRELRAAGGIATDGGTVYFRIARVDNALSPQRAVANVRDAVRSGAVAIVDEGTGVDASWRLARDARLPLGITYQGGSGLVDPETRPNVFRIAPTDRGIAFRLAEYLVPKGVRLALVTDDSGYGREGKEALSRAFGEDPEAVAVRLQVPARAEAVAGAILRARQAGATGLLVWGRASTVAAALTAARSRGWNVPVYAPPSAEDPLLRQQLADRPEWVDGLTFASGRMTAERGPADWTRFQNAFEAAFGPDLVGVRTSTGARVAQPPDYAMYAYDFVRVLAAAVDLADDPDDREAVLRALDEVTIRGANGDERGFNRSNHEGVVDDDVYFARFDDMAFRPVSDDALSSTLPAIDQTR